MLERLDAIVSILNGVGSTFWGYASVMFIQVGVLIVILYLLDLGLRRWATATVRYWMWMLVLVKLMLPPAFHLPTGVARYLPDGTSIQAYVSSLSRDMNQVGSLSRSATPLSGSSRGMIDPTLNLTSTAAAVPTGMTWQAWLFVAWAGGVLLLALYVVHQYMRVKRSLTKTGVAGHEVFHLLDGRCRAIGLKRRGVFIRVTRDLTSPAVCGVLRPTILLPEKLLNQLTADQMNTVLLHELAHIKRGDLIVNLLQSILQILFFYHPLVWAANTIIRRVREQAVDEMVLLALGPKAPSYGRTLLDVARMALLRPAPALGMIGVVESKTALAKRILHIVTRPIPESVRLGLAGASLFLLGALVLLPMGGGGDRDRNMGYALMFANRGMSYLRNGERDRGKAELAKSADLIVQDVKMCLWPVGETRLSR